MRNLESREQWLKGQRTAYDPDEGWHTERGEAGRFLGDDLLQILISNASPRPLDEVRGQFPERFGEERVQALLQTIGQPTDLQYYLGSQYIIIVSTRGEVSTAAVLSSPHHEFGWGLSKLDDHPVADILYKEWQSHGPQWTRARQTLCDALARAIERHRDWERRQTTQSPPHETGIYASSNGYGWDWGD